MDTWGKRKISPSRGNEEPGLGIHIPENPYGNVLVYLRDRRICQQVFPRKTWPTGTNNTLKRPRNYVIYLSVATENICATTPSINSRVLHPKVRSRSLTYSPYSLIIFTLLHTNCLNLRSVTRPATRFFSYQVTNRDDKPSHWSRWLVGWFVTRFFSYQVTNRDDKPSH